MANEYLETLGKYIRYKKEYVGNDTYRLYIKKNEMEFLEKSLQCLESIDKINPSEALKCLERINKEYLTIESEDFDNCFNTIKQTLLKAQEQEKVLEILKPYLRLVDNYLQVRVNFYDDYWLVVKEIADEEELESLKKILGQTQI